MDGINETEKERNRTLIHMTVGELVCATIIASIFAFVCGAIASVIIGGSPCDYPS